MPTLESAKKALSESPILYKALAGIALGMPLGAYLFNSLSYSFKKFDQLEECAQQDELGSVRPQNRRFISLDPENQLLVDSLTWIDDSTIQMKTNPSLFQGKPFKILILARLMSDTANELIENNTLAHQRLSENLTGEAIGKKIKSQVVTLLNEIKYPDQYKEKFLSNALESQVTPDSFFVGSPHANCISSSMVISFSNRVEKSIQPHLIQTARSLSDPSIPENAPHQAPTKRLFKGSFSHEDL